MITRRDFLSGTVLAGASSLVGTPAFAAASKAENLRVAVIGVRSRGKEHLSSLGKNAVAVCDVDRELLAERAHTHGERTGREITTYVDYRELLDKEDIDAVSIATPNHTHCLIAIAALEAGKDVYVEKPVSHNLWEGRQLVAAARKHDRIVQCGTQSRSSPSLQQAQAWLRSGALGKTRYAIGTCFKPRKPIGKLDRPLSIPQGFDYDLWCGPAEKRDLFRPRVHYDWHWDWNTGNGDMGNQGIHQMDIARWFLGEGRLAPRTISIGGRLGYEDAADTPNTQVVYHDYPEAPLIFETRGLPRSKAAQSSWDLSSMDRYRGSGIGVIIQCEAGHLLVPSYTQAIAYDRSGTEVKRWQGGGDHHANWLAAIAAGDRSMLNAEIQEGHLSSALCHTASVSHHLGEKATATEIASRFAGNPLLSGSFERMAGHLRANDIDIDGAEPMLTAGPWLELDAESERFIDNDPANEHLARECREGFVVPNYGA